MVACRKRRDSCDRCYSDLIPETALARIQLTNCSQPDVIQRSQADGHFGRGDQRTSGRLRSDSPKSPAAEFIQSGQQLRFAARLELNIASEVPDHHRRFCRQAVHSFPTVSSTGFSRPRPRDPGDAANAVHKANHTSPVGDRQIDR